MCLIGKASKSLYLQIFPKQTKALHPRVFIFLMETIPNIFIKRCEKKGCLFGSFFYS